MNRSALVATLLVLAALLTGCAQYPMGLSKSEWEALSPGQQARYRQLHESENRKVHNEFVQRSRVADEKVNDLESRVQVQDRSP